MICLNILCLTAGVYFPLSKVTTLEIEKLGGLIVKKTLALFVPSLLMLAAAGTATADMDLCLTPYVGVDAQIRHMPFQKDFGGNVLKKNYPQGNFFAGLKFNDYVGIEAGYEVSKKKSRSVKHNNSDIVFGKPLEQNEPPFIPSVENISYGTSKIYGWNANLMGFLPIFCEDNSLQLIGSVGIAQLKIKSKNELKSLETTATLDSITEEINGSTQNTIIFNMHYKKRKAVLRLSSGIQNMITDCIGIRALVTWENTAKLRVTTGTKVFNTEKPKNSFKYGLGIFTSF